MAHCRDRLDQYDRANFSSGVHWNTWNKLGWRHCDRRGRIWSGSDTITDPGTDDPGSDTTTDDPGADTTTDDTITDNARSDECTYERPYDTRPNERPQLVLRYRVRALA